MTKEQNGILALSVACCYRTLPEPSSQEAQENLEFPLHPDGASEMEDPAEISFVTFSPLHLLQ